MGRYGATARDGGAGQKRPAHETSLRVRCFVGAVMRLACALDDRPDLDVNLSARGGARLTDRRTAVVSVFLEGAFA